jgi:AraC family ethanolamine operon transcriptional activator
MRVRIQDAHLHTLRKERVVPHEGVEFRRFDDPGEICAAQPGVAFQIIPMGTGPFEAELTTIRLPDMALHVGHASPLMGMARTAPDQAVVQLPFENVDTLVLNGVACKRGIVGIYAGDAELLRANPQRSSYAALILPLHTLERLLEPPPGSRMLQPGACTLFQSESSAWTRCERIIHTAIKVAAAAPDVFRAEQPRFALREALVHATHELIAPERSAEIRMPRSARARRRIVIAADEYLRAHMDRPIYTEELCNALAVSASSLAEAFRAIFVVSPHRFLKLRRLSMVRAALQSREVPALLVKSVALAHGFWHLGQFAHDYRETFGEPPSETLARAHGGALPNPA